MEPAGIQKVVTYIVVTAIIEVFLTAIIVVVCIVIVIRCCVPLRNKCEAKPMPTNTRAAEKGYAEMTDKTI